MSDELKTAVHSSLITHHSSLVLLSFAAVLFVSCQRSEPLTARDLANYAGQITFSEFKVGVSENLANQTIYYVDAVVKNGGARTVTELAVNATFRDLDGQIAFREKSAIVNERRKPLAPGESRQVRMGFEGIPDGWNRAAPSLEIIHLAVE